MKILHKISAIMIGVVALLATPSCKSADPEFVHTDNTIQSIHCSNTASAVGYSGTIEEFDAAGKLVSGTLNQDFTIEDIQGGKGVITFVLPASEKASYDLTKVFLKADVSSDVFIEPGLGGRHDITGDGIKVVARSGVGTTREYTIRGYFEE